MEGGVRFEPEAVLKRDHFSEIVAGRDADTGEKLVMRRLSGLPWTTRWLARLLARREITALKAVSGIDGAPRLIRADAEGILRSWTTGLPLNLSPPTEKLWYDDARRILREMRRRGITHNDLNKPQNWLRMPDGRAGVIDFQLARVHRRRGVMYRMGAYEDLRHLLKQKRRYRPEALTPRERAMVEARTWPSRIWRNSVKPLYNFITRRLMNWSDSEGVDHRLQRDGPELVAALKAVPGVRDAMLCSYPMAGRGTGLYAFVETGLEAEALRMAAPRGRVALIQTVPAMPRDASGVLREDALTLVAMNRMDDLEALFLREPGLRDTLTPVIAGRLNLSDREARG
ncbi:MAG: serine/threonine protein kinase [Pararhodobacter sp.]